jgi:histidyl-tRNA synthetase
VGWAAGVDRIALLIDECGHTTPAPRVDVSVVHVRGGSSSSGGGNGADVDALARRACLVLTQQLREAGFTADYTHEGDTRKQVCLFVCLFVMVNEPCLIMRSKI